MIDILELASLTEFRYDGPYNEWTVLSGIFKRRKDNGCDPLVVHHHGPVAAQRLQLEVNRTPHEACYEHIQGLMVPTYQVDYHPVHFLGLVAAAFPNLTSVSASTNE